MSAKWAPLSSSFMVVSIIGFFISIWLFDWTSSLGLKWGFTFMIFFIIMFIASVISTIKTEAIPTDMDLLAVHEHHNRKYKAAKFHKLIKDLKTQPPKHNNFIWQDAIMIVYALLYIIYLTLALTNESLLINFTIGVLILTLFLVIWMLIDAISTEDLGLMGKTFSCIGMIILGGIGVAIYYTYRRVKHKAWLPN